MKPKTLTALGVACGLALACLLYPFISERFRRTEDVELYVPTLGYNPRAGQRVTLVYATAFGRDFRVAVDNGLRVGGREGEGGNFHP